MSSQVRVGRMRLARCSSRPLTNRRTAASMSSPTAGYARLTLASWSSVNRWVRSTPAPSAARPLVVGGLRRGDRDVDPRTRRQLGDREIGARRDRPRDVFGALDPASPGDGERVVDLDDHAAAGDRRLANERRPARLGVGRRRRDEPRPRAVLGGVLAVAQPIEPGHGEQRMTVGFVARHFGEVEREVGVGRRVAEQRPHDRRMDGDRVFGPRPVGEHIDETGPAQARVGRERQHGATSVAEQLDHRPEREAVLGRVVLEVADEPVQVGVGLARERQGEDLGVVEREPGIGGDDRERARLRQRVVEMGARLVDDTRATRRCAPRRVGRRPRRRRRRARTRSTREPDRARPRMQMRHSTRAQSSTPA